MVNIAVVGHVRKIVEKQLPRFGFKLNKKNPDMVISIGGDGTALYAERVYPSIPRIMIKHSKICNRCKEHDFSKVFSALKKGRFEIKEEIKIEGIVNKDLKKKLIGLNEIGIHHKIPIKSIRFRVKVNGKIISHKAIGDGLVVATPYGSTAYFYSISRKKFSKGLGIAFNNTKKRRKSIVVDINSVIEVEILRGKGLMTADENDRMITLIRGDKILIKKAKGKAKIIEIKGKRKIPV